MAVRRALRFWEILEATGWSRSTAYQKIADGKFPEGHKLDPSGKTRIWWADEVEAWQKGEWKPAEVTADAA